MVTENDILSLECHYSETEIRGKHISLKKRLTLLRDALLLFGTDVWAFDVDLTL